VRDFEDPRLARAALECADTVIVQDLLPTQTIEFADVVFPAMSAQERVGSFTTWEGRRQPFASVVPAQGLAQLDWDIIRQLALTMGTDLGWETAADVRREAAPLMEVPVRATERLRALGDPHPQPVDRPSRDEGSFDVVVVDSLLGDGTMLLGAKALKETAAPVTVWVNAEDARRIGLAQGSHVRLTGDAGSVELPAKVTTDVAPGVVVVPGPSSGLAAATLVAPGAVLRVGLEPLDQASDRVSDPTSSSEAVGQ
jgi:NADH-quinone oxidoreductase subunit G